MEISENVENIKHQRNSAVLHSTQSQPILLDENRAQENKDKSVQKSSKNRRVSFASSSQLTQYLEPLNPFESFAVPVSSAEELSNLYKKSCDKHKTLPIPAIIEHLETLNLEKSPSERAEELNLKQQTLTHDSCEALEELFKRVKYRSIDLTSCSLDDISATSLFDMIEYYEAAYDLNISENPNIKNRGIQSCISMIKRSQALHSLSTRGTIISDSNASALGNALITSYIYTLKLEHAQLSGRPILCLSGALQKNKTLKELCLANNELTHNDAFHIGNILKNNYHLQLLDISNNDIMDEGFKHIIEALIYQSIHVSKTSSADSLSSASIHKFDFNDFTNNLNSINNNRNRFCPTPPPHTNLKSRIENSSTLNVNDSPKTNNSNNNNNNSILPCDNDKSDDTSTASHNDLQRERNVKHQPLKQREVEGNNTIKELIEDERDEAGSVIVAANTTIAITSTNNLVEDTDVLKRKEQATAVSNKYKYTAESLSPISHSYDDATGTHTLFTSRSPERSFSSESLCSTESVESNDSKSSIRLIESKFNRNGTLERQNNQSSSLSIAGGNGQYSGEKKATGLQVLILWNNNLTSQCATFSADLFECTEYLQIINFGQNPIGNDFLINTKSQLKSNGSIISIGLQSTNITCEGLKNLAEILEFAENGVGNSTLQRIDLRNNSLLVPGLSTLSEALNTNKTITRIDLDDSPKIDVQGSWNDMLPITTEYQRIVATIRQKCLFNENPPLRIKKPNVTSRKISLTCPSAVKAIPKQQLLEPIKKQAINRSPSPILSPSSPLTSPSRSRFHVSRVSESSSGVSSKSPSSSSSSPTFFPSSVSSSSNNNSRFRVIAVSETPKKSETIPPSSNSLKMSNLSGKIESSKEIDIPISSSSAAIKSYSVNISTSNSANNVSSQSDDQLDFGSINEEKRFIDLDSCSSFSSSIDSIDRQTSDISSTDSFDILDIKTTADVNKTIGNNSNEEVLEGCNDITLTVSTSSSSSNEGLTLTTNSPTADMSPKQEQHKRTRKPSWIHSAISGASSKNNSNNNSSSNNNENSSTSTYPATLDKLLNLFHHPSSIFSKTSPESSLKSASDDQLHPSHPQQKQSSSGMGQKENSISGFLQSLVSLTHNKKEDKSIVSQESATILQNISPENTIGKNVSNSQMVLESLPKSVKKELKENISPENTISCENFAGLATERQQQKSQPKVVFVVGDDSMDIPEALCPDDTLRTEDVGFDGSDTTRDSLAILKPSNDRQNE